MLTGRSLRLGTCLAALLALILTVPAPAAGEPSRALLGQKIDNIPFADAAGKAHPLHELKDRKAIVVVFLSFDCPVSNSYAQPLADMAKQFGKQGVSFVGVCTNPDTTPDQLAQHVKEFGIPFPVYHDKDYAAAKALKAGTTPEAFVLDGGFILRYRGRIDDSYAARLKRNAETSRHELRLAVEEVMAGKSVSVPATVPVGCAIASAPRKPASTDSKVTYYRDVLPILQNHCQVCHRPGEVGPFSLMTYQQAVNWSGDMVDYVTSRKMPPWKPAEGLPFQHERRLSDKDIATLAAWVEQGAPEGDSKDAPQARKFPAGWQLGTPDLVLTVPDHYSLGASGKDVFRCFVLPTNLPEDKYVTAVEVRPGNSRIVHHALLFVDPSGEARKLEQKEKDRKKDPGEKDGGPGYSSSMGVGIVPRGTLGGWAPGQVPHHLPEGTGYSLPKGADVVLQVHYHRDGRDEKDRTSIGLYFAKKPVDHRFQGVVIPGQFLVIPAGEANHRVAGAIEVRQDCTVHSVMPHMHMIGKTVKITMTPPAGVPQTLIHIKDWDYNWQETYFFKEPIAVKKGTRFDIEGVYDNSAANANNPSRPPRPVYIGRETTNEMLFGFLGATADEPGRIRFTPLRGERKPDAGK